MDLAAPLGLALAGLLLPLVLLYVLKVRRARRRVPSTWLWGAARRDLEARSPWQKLRVQLPLVLQALALLILAVGAARPTSHGPSVLADHLAIVVDTSASMSATDPASGATRLELARQVAHERVTGLAPGAEVMVIAAGHEARMVLPFERDRRRIEAALAALGAEAAEGELETAVGLAASRLAELGGRRSLVVVTDGALARPADLGASAVPLEVSLVGTALDNAAIVRVDVQSGRDAPAGREEVQAFLMVANFGTTARELYVTMREDNASDVLASRSIVLAPGERQPVLLGFHATPGDHGRGLVFDLSPHDAMPVDDVAFGRVPEGRQLPVVVSAAEDAPSPWLLRALGADPLVELTHVPLAGLASAPVPHGAFVVLEGSCSAAPGGDLLLVHPPTGRCHGTEVGSAVEAPRITDWDHADPRLRFVGLDGVLVASARPVVPESPRQALVRSDRGALVADASTSGRSVTVVGFDVGESNWPLRASFVLFVRNLLEQARMHRASGLAAAAVVGEPLRAVVPRGVAEVELEVPPPAPLAATAHDAPRERRTLPARDGLCIVPEVDRVGLFRLDWKAPTPGSLVVPVNLASAAESDLRARADAPTTGAAAVTTRAEQGEGRSDWSFLFALCALAFVLFDLWYFGRPTRPVRLAPGAAPRLPDRPPARGATR
ncbi:MAG: VWA domain-containing protein [Polyangiaceae bacterium]|nr:VWA domain-containing protein [Polyangiaceae bacterium]